MVDFFSTEAGKFASLAKQYLEGALVLNDAQRERGKILFLPTLGLAGHGLELILKACMLLNGHKPVTSGRKGHDVICMWDSDICEPIRGHLFVNADRFAKESRDSGLYPDCIPEDEVLQLIDEYIRALGNLHGMSGVYPLRYPTSANTMAPRTPFLVQSLWATADDFVKRPTEFILNNFRNLS